MFQLYDKDTKFLKSQVLRFNLIFSGFVKVQTIGELSLRRAHRIAIPMLF